MGSVQGSVQDASGATLAKVSLTATHLDTRWARSTVTDEQGNYILNLMPVGRYEIAAGLPGFKRAVRPEVQLHVGEKLDVDFTLEVGNLTEDVEITAALTRINHQDGSLSDLLGPRQITSVPINGRYFNQLVTLMPGTVSYIPQGPSVLAFNRAGAAVNGQRPNTNNWSIDGVYVVDTGGGWNFNNSPTIEAVAEFRLVRANYDAEYGTSAGGHVNIITRSGSQDFHGQGFEFLRNDRFDARNFFSRSVPPLRFNDVGFAAGGPVWIPGVYNRAKDKTFFFASMAWQRIRRGLTFAQVVPTEAQRRGDFSALAQVIRDPDSGQPFPGNIIPTSRIDPNAIALTRLTPLPNRPGEALNWTGSPSTLIRFREDLLRIDHHVSRKTQAMFRLSRNAYFFRTPVPSPVGSGFPEFTFQRDSTGGSLAATAITSFSPTLQNEFVFGHTWNRLPQRPVGQLDPTLYGVTIPQLFPDSPETYPLRSMHLNQVIAKVPNIVFNGYGNLFNINAWSNATHIWQFKDNGSKIIGDHHLKFGVLFHQEWKFEPTNEAVEGTFVFDGSATSDAYADFLLGRAAVYSEPNRVNFLNNLRSTFEGYVNDRWRIARRLSLSLGVRYSYFQVPRERDRKYRVFDPDHFDPGRALKVTPNGFLLPGTGDPLNGLVEPTRLLKDHLANVAPRLSFAWDPWGTGKMVVRGGYGIFYSREVLEGFMLLAGNPPFAQQQTVFNTLLSNPGRGLTATFAPEISSVDLRQDVPYYQHWILGIQRQILADTVLDVSYVGTKGTHLMRTVNLNQPLPNPAVARREVSAHAVRPYLGWGDILHRQQSYSSSYHGLQASLSRNFSQGLGLQIAYTYSKTIDDAEYPGMWMPAANSRDLRLERGLSSFDVPHSFVAGFVWELPLLRDQRGLRGKALGGWQLAGITRFSSGQPVDVTLGRDLAGVGGGLQRPQIVGHPNLPRNDQRPDRMFRPEAFAAPALGTFATTSRNPVRGPGVHNWDVALAKTFHFGESTQLEFRSDFFNVFNHTQFATVGTEFYSASFGHATSARQPREVQFGLSLSF
jgi:hypothetical protein